MKTILFEDSAREALLMGTNKVADAVKITLGARGRNAIIFNGYTLPSITNDGVTIAKEIELPNEVENAGAQIIKDVAIKTNNEAGDGTTTSIVLAQSLISYGLKLIKDGANPMELRNAMLVAKEEVIKKLKPKTKLSHTDIVNIASVSSESNEIGKIIAQAIEKVGKDGTISINPSIGSGISCDFFEGLEIDSKFITNQKSVGQSVVVILAGVIYSREDIIAIVEQIKSRRQNRVIIFGEVEGEALSAVEAINLRGTSDILVLKKPQDIEILEKFTGAKETDTLEYKNFGSTKQLLVNKKIYLVGEKNNNHKEFIKKIKKDIEISKSQIEKDRLREKLGIFLGKVAMINIGVRSETEFSYLRDKIIDTIAATKGAFEEGIIEGGGCALARINLSTQDKKLKEGFEVVRQSLVAPLRQIIKNSGRTDDEVLIEEIKKTKLGFNALNSQLEDIYKIGIVDPLKVTRTAFENAVSVASVFLTAGVVIAEKPEEKPTDYKK